MLEKGLGRFSSLKGLIIHSDQGWQYQHAYFRNTIKEKGIIQSMSRKGNCYDNSIMDVVRRIKRCVIRQIIRYEFAA